MTQENEGPGMPITYSRAQRSKVSPVSGSEQFIGVGAKVLDFWQWAVSDLQTNTVRSMLAEYLVALAVGATNRRRVEWDNFDVLSSEHIRIEVKATAYRQSWYQKQHSVPRFGGFRGREWDWDTSVYIGEPKIRADVFVFAVQICLDDATYNVLDVGQWEFYVLPAAIIQDHAGESVGLQFVRKHGGEAVSWDQLHEAIRKSATRIADSNF